MRKYNAIVENSLISKKFGMPKQTISDWDKSNNWRNELLGKLRMYASLENDAETLLQNLFTDNELNAIKESIEEVVINEDVVMNNEHLMVFFKKYCEMDSEKASKYGDIEKLLPTVTEKIAMINAWHRYCLFELLASKT